MRAIGIILLVLASVLFGNLFSAESKKGVGELKSFVGFLSFAAERAACYFEPSRITAEKYSDPYLENTGFLAELRSGEAINAPLSRLIGRLDVDSKDRRELTALAEGIELNSCEGYSKGLNSLSDAAARVYTKRAAELDGRSRAVKISAVSIGLGLAILLI